MPFRRTFLLLAGLSPLLIAFPVYQVAIQLSKQVYLARWVAWIAVMAAIALVGAALVAVVARVLPARLGRSALFAGVLANVAATGLAIQFGSPKVAPTTWLGGTAVVLAVLLIAYWRKADEDQVLALRGLATAGGGLLAVLGLALPYVAYAALTDAPRNPLAQTPPTTPALKIDAPKRIVLVTFDELGRGNTSLADPKRDTTPRLAELADEGTRFTNTHAAGDQTLVSMPTVLTGLRPPEVFGRVRNEIGYIRQGSLTGVAAYLKAAGYRTGYATLLVTPQTFGMRDEYDDGFGASTLLDNRFNGRGFVPLLETFDKLAPTAGATRVSTLPADLHPIYGVVEQGLAIYNEPANRSFLWVHMGLPHHPYYRIPKEDLGKPIRPAAYPMVHPFHHGHLDDPGFYRSAYLDYVRFSDAMLGKFIDGLRASPHWKDTLLIVTADHGNRLDPAQRGLYGMGEATEGITHVPLVIHAPGQRKTRRVDAAARHEDLVPTILARVYQQVPASFKGASLLDSELPGDRIGYTWAMRPNAGFGPEQPRSVVAYQGRHRLTVRYPERSTRLTDWRIDPEGTRDLRHALPRKAEALQTWLQRELNVN